MSSRSGTRPPNRSKALEQTRPATRSSAHILNTMTAADVSSCQSYRWAVGAFGGEVPRAAAQDLLPRADRPGRSDQPVHAYRTPESGDGTETDHHRRPVRCHPDESPRPVSDDGAARHRDRVALGRPIALRPRDIDFTTRIITVRRTIVEVARKNSPTGEAPAVKAAKVDH